MSLEVERLARKVAIITGAGQGLGRTVAELFAREGASVVAADINSVAANETAKAISANGGRAIAVEMDVTSASDVRRMVGEATDAFGAIDVLVNNAAIIGTFGNIIDIPEETWDQVMAVNLKGPFLCSKYVLPLMQDQGSGSIVNVSSTSGVLANEHQAAYNASKHGVVGLTRCIAQDCGRFGIRANAVCPTGMNTPMTKTANLGRDRAESPPAAAQTVIGRLAEPIEVARAILFLASEEASFVTGAIIMVDGGLTAMQPSYRQLAAGMEGFLTDRP